MGERRDLSKEEIHRILDVTEKDIAPQTREAVHAGCKLFGAAILRKSDLSVVVASTNRETGNPLFHGEISTLNEFYAMPEHPPAKDCIFYATHEPCSLCLSGITWGGFDNFCYFFTYEDSRDEFKTPYDIDILEQVFRVADPGRPVDPQRPLYNRENKYFLSTALKQRIAELGDPALAERCTAIKALYDELSAIYQKNKGSLILP